MRHNLKISVSKEPQSGGIVQCRNVSLREKPGPRQQRGVGVHHRGGGGRCGL